MNRDIARLAHDLALTDEVRKISDFDGIMRAIFNDIIENEDFDIILDDMIHKFARDLDEMIFDRNDLIIFDEDQIANMIGETLGMMISR